MWKWFKKNAKGIGIVCGLIAVGAIAVCVFPPAAAVLGGGLGLLGVGMPGLGLVGGVGVLAGGVAAFAAGVDAVAAQAEHGNNDAPNPNIRPHTEAINVETLMKEQTTKINQLLEQLKTQKNKLKKLETGLQEYTEKLQAGEQQNNTRKISLERRINKCQEEQLKLVELLKSCGIFQVHFQESDIPPVAQEDLENTQPTAANHGNRGANIGHRR